VSDQGTFNIIFFPLKERSKHMSKKITIIGAGNVGATIAYTLSLGNIASEILLIDINKEKAAAEVMDIVQGTSFREPVSVIAGDYEDAKDSDIVVITSGVGRKPGQTRIDLAQINVNILRILPLKSLQLRPRLCMFWLAILLMF
jgi:L-lactate dehydrogenase